METTNGTNAEMLAAAAAMTSTTTEDEQKIHHHHLRKGMRLQHWRDMPKHLQFNPYIHTGYRPLLTFWGCINSLFYLHNETINILTHAIPIIYIIATVPPLMPWTQLWFLSWCHVIGLVSPWVGSFLYHLFMNLDQGEKLYCRLLQIDMLGIWINQSFGALPMVTASTYCLPSLIRWSFIGSYVLLSLWGLYKALTAWSPWERRLCFLMPFTLRVILCFLRYWGFGGGDPGAFTHVILQLFRMAGSLKWLKV
ncbi:progestin and adipoQ receptor family member 4 isoform X2 [Atheta coriaria]|uniref:progestin and adipoQ receptor family member 4 isoform X2 n=1 Tax=Dalotia coriaria TaxID=877792 RepID=UPI0031F3C753